MKYIYRDVQMLFLLPLNIPLYFASDYIPQTANELSRRGRVVLYEFRNQISIYGTIFNKNVRKKAFDGWIDLLYSENNKIIHIFPLRLFPENNWYVFHYLNIMFSVFQIRLFLYFYIRKRKLKVILWGFHPLMKYFVQFGGYSQSVYDCVDYYDDDISPWYNLRRLEEYVFIHADSIAFNSGVLRNRKLEKYPYIRNNSYVVPCGCNISLFHTKKKGKPKKAESELRIGMVGHINFRIDFDLLLLLARHKPEWRFFVVGPVMASRIEDQLYEVEKNVRQLKTYINVSFIGRRQKDTLPDLLTSFDVCIIPYRTSHGSVKFCNPMKAYEYFALGKPVVSTSIPALQELDHHIISFADDYVTFAAFIEKLSTQWSNTRTQIAERTAQEHSWENKVSAILRHLK